MTVRQSGKTHKQNSEKIIPETAAPLRTAKSHRNPRSLLHAAFIVSEYLCAFIALDFIALQFQELQGIVAWYPPAGLTYALLLTFGAGFIPVVTLVLLMSSVFIYRMPQPLHLLFLWALIISLIYGAAVAFLRKRNHFDWQLRKIRDVTWFIGTTVVVSALLAILSVLSSALSSSLHRSEIPSAIFHWWIGETVGVLTVTPFLLVNVMPFLKRFIEGRSIKSPIRWSFTFPSLPVIGQVLVLVLTLFWVFSAHSLDDQFHPLFLLTLPLIWIGLYHGFKGITAGIVAMNFGVMVGLWAYHFELTEMGELQLLMVINCIVGLYIGAVVTDRRQVEMNLRDSEERFRLMFEATNSIKLLIEPDSGKIVDVNPAAVEFYGYTREQLISMKIDDINQLPPEKISAERQKAKQEKRNYFIFPHRLAGGQIRLMEVHSYPITVKNNVLLYSILYDITERKLAEEKIKYQASLLANVNDAIIASDENYKISAWNEAAEFMYGWKAEEVLGHPGLEIIRTEYSDIEKQNMLQQINDIGKWRGEVIQERKNGVRFPVEISSIVTKDEKGKITGYVSVNRDITERKQAEAEIILSLNQLATAREIGKTLTETLELDQIYERLYRAVVKIMPDSETMFVSLFNNEKKEFRCVFALNENEQQDISQLPPAPLEPPGIGTQSEVVRTKKPLIANNLQERLKKVSLVVDVGKGSEQPQSGLYVPMLAKDEVIGVVMVQSQELNRYTPDDAEMLSLVANTAASAIQNAQLFAQTERRLQQISAMHTIDTTISSSFDLDRTFTILLEIVTSQLGVDAADVLVLNKNNQILECRGRRGFHTQALQYTKLPVGQGLAGRAALERKILVIKDLPGEINGLINSPELAAEGFAAYFGVPLTAKGEIIGVLEIFHREKLEPAKEWFDYLENLAGQAAIAIDNSMLFNNLQRSNLDLSLAYDATILGWSSALDLRDKETEGHSQRVMEMTMQLANRMELSEAELVQVRRGSLLHDIGKMGVADSILLKPGALTDEEWVSMRSHPLLAYNLLAPIPYLQKALEIPYCHHEKWDGSGYPQGLKGEAIPLAARIFAIVDVWDALISDRPYRKAWTKKKALEYIQEQSGKHFDPQVVKAFLVLIREGSYTV